MDILKDATELNSRQKRRLVRMAGGVLLTDRERVFVREYTEHLDGRRAAKVAGYSSGGDMAYKLLNTPPYVAVRAEVDRVLAVREAESELRGEYVREYIVDVMEFCPTDYFTISPDGGWTIEEDRWRDVPHKYKRLVEGIELKFVGRRAVLCVKFVSKTAALAMAAKYTLTQKLAATVSSVPWERIAKELEVEGRDAIAERLAEYEGEASGAEGSEEIPEVPLAGRDDVRPPVGSRVLGRAV
jgi:phage terminase small subunit